MKQVFVMSGHIWELDAKKEVMFLLRSSMTPLARVRAQFVQDSLIPSSHKSEVRWDTLVAIYFIIRGHPIDVARIIFFRIYMHYNMGGDKLRPIYPHLITSTSVRESWETSLCY